MDNVGASKAAPWGGSGRRGLRRRAAGACGRRGSSAAPWQIALCPPSACLASPALCCACARLHSAIESTVSPVASGCITSSGTAGRARIPGPAVIGVSPFVLSGNSAGPIWALPAECWACACLSKAASLVSSTPDTHARKYGPASCCLDSPVQASPAQACFQDELSRLPTHKGALLLKDIKHAHNTNETYGSFNTLHMSSLESRCPCHYRLAMQLLLMTTLASDYFADH